MSAADAIAAMRSKLAEDAAAARDYWPEGSMMRPIVEVGITLRHLGVEILAASPVPRLYDWLAQRL